MDKPQKSTSRNQSDWKKINSHFFYFLFLMDFLYLNLVVSQKICFINIRTTSQLTFRKRFLFNFSRDFLQLCKHPSNDFGEWSGMKRLWRDTVFCAKFAKPEWKFSVFKLI
jgi:hypothetical protein